MRRKPSATPSAEPATPAPDDAVELQAPLDVVDGWPPIAVEALWARRLPGASDRYRLDSVPAFALDLAWRDEVRAHRQDGAWVIAEVVGRGGHSALRVLVDPAADADAIVEKLSALGAGVQRSFIPALLTLDLAPTLDAEPVLRALDAAEAEGDLEWQEGWLAPAHRRPPPD